MNCEREIQNITCETADSPLVTIGVPCFNHENYLSDLFESILHQTYRNLELVIIDDCSQDNSCIVIEHYIPIIQGKGIKVYFEKHDTNRGISRTCNEIVKKSNGKYIKIIASDDMLLPECISHMTRYMEGHQESKMLVCNVSVVEDDYKYGETYSAQKNMDIEKIRSIENIHEELFNSCFINSPGIFVNRVLYDICGYYDENLGYEDWDYLIRVSKAVTIDFLDEILVLYRKSTTSISNYQDANASLEKKEKISRMYAGTRDLFRKHRGELPEDKWSKYLGKRYLLFLNDADTMGYADLKRQIFKDMKKDGIKILSFRQMMAYRIKSSAPGLFKAIKHII